MAQPIPIAGASRGVQNNNNKSPNPSPNGKPGSPDKRSLNGGSLKSTGSGEGTPSDVVLRQKLMNGSPVDDLCDCKPSAFGRVRRSEPELVRRRSASVLEMKEAVHHRLKDELLKAQTELKLKDEECQKLSRIQDQLNNEVEELTAKLFEEANNMVQDAHIKRMHAEKLLKEANSKIDVLQAEVTALKTLVITSTPSMPSQATANLEPPKEKKSIFKKGHRRATSHHVFKEMHPIAIELTPDTQTGGTDKEVDPVYFEEFKSWRAGNPTRIRRDAPFLLHIIREDILPCLNFSQTELSNTVYESVLSNTLLIEPLPTPEKNPFPRRCSLTDATRVCKFRIKVGDSDDWHVISTIVRNRIAAVCDFITYIRYITLGLVKSSDADIYWEIMRLRKMMNLARLGLPTEEKSSH